jgi:hypothetical protein
MRFLGVVSSAGVTRRQLMIRQYIIAAILVLIFIANLGIGGFPPAIAIAIALTGMTVILMMALEGWP